MATSEYVIDDDGDLWLMFGQTDDGKVMLAPVTAEVRFVLDPDRTHRIVRDPEGLRIVTEQLFTNAMQQIEVLPKGEGEAKVGTS